ncbi:hypothetical protein LCGC14_1400670 [marine sediment metagenome]|uniref:HNH domain-containing protein n=1 Tax=marine sediment metagenome TaxID=412755 RepID=A0A0F9KI51_9ZZZZ
MIPKPKKPKTKIYEPNIKTSLLDAKFSEVIRRRAIQKDNGDTFPAWKLLQCSHFIGRAKKSVRWDEDNASGLCGGCHMYFTAHPDEHTEFFKDRLGDKFDLLQARKHQIKPDKYLIYLHLDELLLECKKRIKEME